jgi:adenylosuccinate lyase
MTNTAILERKGLSEKDIKDLEDICLGTKEALIKQGIDSAKAEETAKIIDANEKLKRRMHAISPLEGRYDRYVEKLHSLTSEFEWQKRRVEFEIEYLIAFTDELHENYEGDKRTITHRRFTEDERGILRGLYQNMNDNDFRIMQILDRKINHDIVAMTTWIVYSLGDSMGDLKDEVESALHFSRTSEDINSNVYSTIVRDLMKEYLSSALNLQEALIKKAESREKKYEQEEVVFAGQTHGQFAEYTTLRKVFANFVSAIDTSLRSFVDEDCRQIQLTGKIGGAIGNESDLYSAYPEHNWIKFHREFLEDMFSLESVDMADQPEFNLRHQQVYDYLTRTDCVMQKVCSDFWMYCSRGLFSKKVKQGESGSSVMAQKANPWLSEGAEEYLTEANEQIAGFERLMKYRMQGHLARSIQMRGIGEPFGKSIVGMKRLVEEIEKYEPNYKKIREEVSNHPEMCAAVVQTILRREGVSDAYDVVKEIIHDRREEDRDRPITFEDFKMLADKYCYTDKKISESVRREIYDAINPENNTGIAKKLADDALMEAKTAIGDLRSAYNIPK